MKEKSDYFYTKQEDIYPFERASFSHKGTFGHAYLVAGSYRMMGTAVLATKACLRSGVGKITTHIPRKCVDILQITVPEAIIDVSLDEDYLSGKLGFGKIRSCRYWTWHWCSKYIWFLLIYRKKLRTKNL